MADGLSEPAAPGPTFPAEKIEPQTRRVIDFFVSEFDSFLANEIVRNELRAEIVRAFAQAGQHPRDNPRLADAFDELLARQLTDVLRSKIRTVALAMQEGWLPPKDWMPPRPT